MTESGRTSEEINPPPIGNLEHHAPPRILAALGRLRFTGELRFTVGQKTHAVDVRGGLASDEGDSARAMELFMAAVSGPYELRERLPLLPKSVRETERSIRGSLADSSPPELLNFCETVGLTGKLTLERDGRECLGRYVKGELVSLTLDGQDDQALDAVFAWNEGRYAIAQRNAFDEEGPSSITDLRPALGTIELALSDILKRSSKGQLPGAKAKPKTIPPSIAPPSPDQSVKIIFRSPKLERDSKTAHASANVGREVVALDTATASGPLDDAKAEAIVAKARASAEAKEREDSAKNAALSAAASDNGERARPEPASREQSAETAPSQSLSMGLALVLALALLVGLASLASMAGSAGSAGAVGSAGSAR